MEMNNTMDEIKPITFKKEIEIIITVQAQKTLAGSKYSIDEFTKWALEDQKISMGGQNVMLFLDYKYDESKQKSK
jgi:hypothetical protein